jgi:hypothetical protein
MKETQISTAYMYLLINLCGTNDLATESKVSQNKYFIEFNSIESLNLK